MNIGTDLKWIDEEYAHFEKYGFLKGNMLEIKAFMDAKKKNICFRLVKILKSQ